MTAIRTPSAYKIERNDEEESRWVPGLIEDMGAVDASPVMNDVIPSRRERV